MAAIRKYSLVDQIYNSLRRDILSLSYPLGAKLSVAELEKVMGVSCTPIREAINRLQQEGLVIYTTNIGARVISLEPHDVEEIQQLSLTLHHAAIRFALAGKIQEDLVPQLRRQLEKYVAASTEEQEVSVVNQFLGVYYHNCGNRRLDSSMLSIQGQQLLLRRIYAGLTGRGESREIFEQMVLATHIGNADQVCRLLTDYTDTMTAVVKQHIEQPGM